MDYVVHMHLKDSRGGYRDWYFTAMGDGGAVDFARIGEITNNAGFFGPYSLEIEGIQRRAGTDTGAAPRAGRPQCEAFEIRGLPIQLSLKFPWRLLAEPRDLRLIGWQAHVEPPFIGVEKRLCATSGIYPIIDFCGNV